MSKREVRIRKEFAAELAEASEYYPPAERLNDWLNLGAAFLIFSGVFFSSYSSFIHLF